MELENLKEWYKSKTVWVNVLTFVLGVIAIFTSGEGAPLVSAQIMQWLFVGAAVVNLILRVWFTEQGLK